MHLLSDLITLWKGCEWCIKNIIWGSIPLYNYIIIQERGGTVSTNYLPEKKKKQKEKNHRETTQVSCFSNGPSTSWFKVTFYVPVGGHWTFPKGCLTIPKRSPAEFPGRACCLASFSSSRLQCMLRFPLAWSVQRWTNKFSRTHTGRLTAGTYKSPMKRKENDLHQTSMTIFHVNVQWCKFWPG